MLADAVERIAFDQKAVTWGAGDLKAEYLTAVQRPRVKHAARLAIDRGAGDGWPVRFASHGAIHEGAECVVNGGAVRQRGNCQGYKAMRLLG